MAKILVEYKDEVVRELNETCDESEIFQDNPKIYIKNNIK